jgi:hypothetical protein
VADPQPIESIDDVRVREGPDKRIDVLCVRIAGLPRDSVVTSLRDVTLASWRRAVVLYRAVFVRVPWNLGVV